MKYSLLGFISHETLNFGSFACYLSHPLTIGTDSNRLSALKLNFVSTHWNVINDRFLIRSGSVFPRGFTIYAF